MLIKLEGIVDLDFTLDVEDVLFVRPAGQNVKERRFASARRTHDEKCLPWHSVATAILNNRLHVRFPLLIPIIAIRLHLHILIYVIESQLDWVLSPLTDIDRKIHHLLCRVILDLSAVVVNSTIRTVMV